MKSFTSLLVLSLLALLALSLLALLVEEAEDAEMLAAQLASIYIHILYI